MSFEASGFWAPPETVAGWTELAIQAKGASSTAATNSILAAGLNVSRAGA